MHLSAAGAAGERVFGLLDAEEEIPDPATGIVPQTSDGKVSFKHVKFGYLPDKLLMTDVSIDVKPGQKCAIVGPTGAGKTTLINLLMRFYEINGGEIWVDGVNTKEMTSMENGDIKEVGDHDQLMALGGKYAVLYNSQFV